MAKVLTGISGNLISAASAGFAPTNSADVSAIASAYQVVSATATQLYAGTAYVTSINDAPISAARAGNAANASMATSAYYDGTGRLISALPDSAAVSAIASSYAESAASGKQDELTFGYDTANAISSIDGSSLAGGGIKVSPSGTLWISGESAESTDSAFIPGVATATFVQSGGSFSITDAQPLTVAGANKVTIQDANWFDGTLYVSGNGMRVSSVEHTGQDWPQTFTAEAPISIGSNSFLWVNKYSAFSAGTSPDQVVPLAHASALPTYQYNTADQISSINGSALGGMDEAAVSGIASAYAESAVSSKADASALSGYYTTANESGFITGVDLSDYATTAYVDSAVSSKADSSALSSYALSADVSGAVDLVSTQSANWGGSALALSAGPGVKFEKSGNTLVASTDETLLWSGDMTTGGTRLANLSEPLTNFERLGFLHSFEGTAIGRPQWAELAAGFAQTTGTSKVIGTIGPAMSLKPWENNDIYQAFGNYVSPSSATNNDQIYLRGAKVLLNGGVQDFGALYHCYAIYGINRTAEA